MPARKQHSEPEVVKLLKLNNDYKIRFRPPATATDWDRENLPCRGLFDQIAQIRTIKFVEYPPEGHADSDNANRKKLLVRKIQANAARCRRERDNEAGWINNVASLVFDRLDGTEFDWCVVGHRRYRQLTSYSQRCNGYLWMPDYIALPSDRIAADSLLRRLDRRHVCRCTVAQRADITQ